MALSGQEIANLAYQAGFRGDGLTKVIAISKRESGWEPTAWNGDTGTGDQSVGLMQINLIGNMGPERARILREMGYPANTVDDARRLLQDPRINLAFAFRMSSGGTDFYHWGPYKGVPETYNTNLGEAAQLASQVDPNYTYVPGAPRAGDMSSGGGRTAHSMEELDAEIEAAKNAATVARQKAAANPDDDLAAQQAEDASSYYFQLVSMKLDLEAADKDRADTAFSQGIALGDFQGRQADRAFEQWSTKRQAALNAANSAIEAARGRNQENAEVEKARYENFGQGPQAETRTYLPPNFDEALAKWEAHYGATGEPPSADLGSYGGPSYGGGGGTDYSQTGSSPTGLVESPITAGLDDIPKGAAPEGVPTDSAVTPWYWRDRPTFGGGRVLNRNNPSGVPAPATQSTSRKKGRRWWQSTLRPIGPYTFANGTDNAPPGMAMVGEKGPETMIDQQGQPSVVGQYGPEVRQMMGGEQILPADIPPDEGFAYAQMQQAMRGAGARNRAQTFAEQEQRRNDPQLREKVMAALYQAVTAQTVATPPETPMLSGPWTKPDPWNDWRMLSGVPATQEMVQQ